MKAHTGKLLVAVAGAAVLGFATQAGAADEKAAQTLARQSGCFKCHAVDKKKEGPAFKETAAKYKGKADAEDTLTKEVTTSHKAKFADGHEEDHPTVKTKDAGAVKNLVQWILSL